MARSGVLLVASDPRIIADVRRLTAVAGVDAEQVPSLPAAPAAVERAELLLLDVAAAASLADALPAAAGSGLGDALVVTDDADGLDVWRSAARLGAGVVVLPADEPRLLDRLGLAGGGRAAAPVIAVVPGAGGAGASLAAAAVALAGAAAGGAVLLDVDPAAGGVDLLVGEETAPGARWDELRSVRGAVSATGLVDVLPRSADLLLLSGGRNGPPALPAEAVTAVLPALRRVAPLLVADLPGRPTEAAALVAATSSQVIVVALDDVRAATCAAGVVRWARELCADVKLVIRTRPRAQIRPADIAAAVGVEPFVLPSEPAIAAAADQGRLAAALSRSRLGAWAAGVVTETAGSAAAAVA